MTPSPAPAAAAPPTPRPAAPQGGMPVINRGMVARVKGLLDFWQDPLAYLVNAHRQYGERFILRSFDGQLVVLNHPEGVKHVLQTNAANYTKGEKYAEVRTVLGQGLLTSEGELWRTQRRTMQPAFHRRQLERVAGDMVAATQALLDEWDARLRPPAPGQQGTPLPISQGMMRLALDVVGRALFGRPLANVAGAVDRHFGVVNHLVNNRVMRPWNPPLAWPLPSHRRLFHSLHALDAIVYDLIRSGHQQGDDAVGGLLALLLAATDEETGHAMNDRQVRDEVMTLFLAGHETSANALSWALHLLSQHPDVQDRVAHEAQTALGNQPPTFAHLPQLAYTTQVLDEAMRLYPPAWVLTRYSLADDRVQGDHLPARTNVLISPYVVHRHPDFWPDPERFDPSRHTPERKAQRPRYAFIPFGAGPRVCIGQAFAQMETAFALAMLVRRFRFFPLPGHTVETEPLITLRPKGGLRLAVARRNG